jgi:hypothetical protein
MAGLYTWSELGLSVPRRVDPESREEKSVPCNGGEKNYVQHPLSSASRRHPTDVPNDCSSNSFSHRQNS